MPESEKRSVRPAERKQILTALRAGVVPRTGLDHIQVGRAREIEAVLEDLDHVADRGSAVRFIIGEYGSGKTFFLNLLRQLAMEKGLVAVNGDLSPDRRLQSSGDHARQLYSELMRNMSTRTKPDGGALQSVVERFIGETRKRAKEEGQETEDLLAARLSSLQDLVSGYDFASAIQHYWRSYEAKDASGTAAALRWLRAEYPRYRDAKNDLDVSSIIDDGNWYDYLKLMAEFTRMAGYQGLVAVFDEMVNLYKLQHGVSRRNNYEQILRILNDSLQGHSRGLKIVFGGTPAFLTDPHRGLYSYEALQSRLAENSFATEGLVDLSGPVIRLQNLTQEDLFVLLENIRRVFESSTSVTVKLPDEALQAFMHRCFDSIGAAYFRTPRQTIRSFCGLLAVLEQNPGASWQALLDHVEVVPDADNDSESTPSGQTDQFSTRGKSSTDLEKFSL